MIDLKTGVVTFDDGTVLRPRMARAETPPDLVMKKDGTVMRGTISEAIPDKYVEIVLPTGATRRA